MPDEAKKIQADFRAFPKSTSNLRALEKWIEPNVIIR